MGNIAGCDLKNVEALREVTVNIRLERIDTQRHCWIVVQWGWL